MSEMALEYKLRPFTVDEYHRMAEAGVLDPEERVELIDGAIVEMSPIGKTHWARHARIVKYLIQTLGASAEVVGQSSLPLGTRDEPQPDVAILAPRTYEGPAPYPSPAEIYAAIEIADTSLRKDLGPKLRLYARHGIADHLVVDVNEDVLLHYRDPHDGGYRACERLGAENVFSLRALPGITLAARAFLGTSD
ncbi:MAG TPA: Uma2 family endonuclease [Candidatus Limnocylindria bacterium]|jgi:Uma2 family endonuclease|nr:Uma2 family endonuclease [Candidatus Limnocylindria bacterium]